MRARATEEPGPAQQMSGPRFTLVAQEMRGEESGRRNQGASELEGGGLGQGAAPPQGLEQTGVGVPLRTSGVRL